MVTPFIQWNVWLNHSFDGANDGETHAEGNLKKTIRPNLRLNVWVDHSFKGTYGKTIHQRGQGWGKR